MTRNDVRGLLKIYREELIRHGATKPLRNSDAPDVNHLLWMCNEIETFLNVLSPKHWSKAMRWLGFMQGAMCCWGIRSIEQMRSDNQGERP